VEQKTLIWLLIFYIAGVLAVWGLSSLFVQAESYFRVGKERGNLKKNEVS